MDYIFGYVSIFISVGFGIIKGFGSKKVSASVKTLRDNLDISLFRNIICSIFSLIIVLLLKNPDLKVGLIEIVISAIAGISMAIFISSWIFAIKSDSYMLVSACASSSFIVPAVIGIFFLNEKLSPSKVIAFIIIVISLFFLLKYNTKLNGKIKFKTLLLLATVLLSQGVNQSMQKFFTNYSEKDISYYTFYSAIFTVLAIIAIYPFTKKDKTEKEASVLLNKKILFYATLMAIALFGNSYFMTLASKKVDAIILYPIANALSLGGSSAMSSIFFGEKMNRDSVIGVLLVFISLLFISLETYINSYFYQLINLIF